MTSPLSIQIVDMLDGDELLVQLSDGTTIKITLEQILSLDGERTAAATADPQTEAPFSGETGT